MRRIKQIIALILSASIFLTACESSSSSTDTSAVSGMDNMAETASDVNLEDNNVDSLDIVNNDDLNSSVDTILGDVEVEIPDFYGLDDDNLIQYVEDKVYAELESNFASDDYIVEDVEAIYISKTYLDELEYNSRSNIYFGYTLEEIEEQFQGTKYVFTLGDDGSTVVRPFEKYDDTFDQVVKNVAIGTGVILICVTVSVVTSGLGAPAAVSLVFAAAAKTGAEFAISSAVISAVATAAVTGYQTGDVDQALKAAALSGSESFKVGAIIGCVAGGLSEVITLRRATQFTGHILDGREAEIAAEQVYPGETQVSFLGGQRVPSNTPYATKPDIIRTIDGHLEAIEVKSYDLVNNRSHLIRELRRQIAARVENLPPGSTQRIVLNVEGRGYNQAFMDSVIELIQTNLADIYPNIPIEVMGTVI